MFRFFLLLPGPTMTSFFRVSHNSFENRRLPWVESISTGLEEDSRCRGCGAVSRRPVGDLLARLERNKADRWPDILGSGSYPLFIVSDRVLNDWKKDGVNNVSVGGGLTFSRPLPDRLKYSEPPGYFWLDGMKMLGARMDFEASGFVDVEFCLVCGRRTDNIAATYQRQHSAVCPYTFFDGSWSGSRIFTSDLSPAAFFCTQKLISCATRNRHTNYRFLPAESGADTSNLGIGYLDGRGN